MPTRARFRWRCASCEAHGVSRSQGNAERLLTVHYRTYHLETYGGPDGR